MRLQLLAADRPLPTMGTAPLHPTDQWESIAAGKEFRQRVRTVMGRTAAGWVRWPARRSCVWGLRTRRPSPACGAQGYSGYGNCGVYIGKLIERPIQLGPYASEEFQRTDSDLEEHRRHDGTWSI
jgi:hypothetical protein